MLVDTENVFINIFSLLFFLLTHNPVRIGIFIE